MEFFQFTFIAKTFILIVLKIVLLLVSIAYFTLAERKIMASIQRRRGPNVVGLWGLLQPLADGLKLLVKEILIPSKSNAYIFFLSPLLILTFSLLSWSIIPFNLLEGEKGGSVVAYIVMAIVGVIGIGCGVAAGRGAEWARKTLWGKQNKLNESLDTIPQDLNGIVQNKQINPKESLYTSLQDLIEISFGISNTNYGLLILLSISSIIVYLLIIGGWASNSKYAFLGALRSAAQMVSYEVSISLVLLPVVLLAGTLNLAEIVVRQSETIWFWMPLLTCTIIFLISMLAETNRTPFDLPEAEAELVAGYNTEYSSINFAMFFLGEYCNMLLMSALMIIVFVGGWLISRFFQILNCLLPSFIFSFKISVICFFFVLVRATYPRYRYDQLMWIGWKIFLPITLSFLIFITGLFRIFDIFVYVYEIIPHTYSGNLLLGGGVVMNIVFVLVPIKTTFFQVCRQYSTGTEISRLVEQLRLLTQKEAEGRLNLRRKVKKLELIVKNLLLNEYVSWSKKLTNFKIAQGHGEEFYTFKNKLFISFVEENRNDILWYLDQWRFWPPKDEFTNSENLAYFESYKAQFLHLSEVEVWEQYLLHKPFEHLLPPKLTPEEDSLRFRKIFEGGEELEEFKDMEYWWAQQKLICEELQLLYNTCFKLQNYIRDKNQELGNTKFYSVEYFNKHIQIKNAEILLNESKSLAVDHMQKLLKVLETAIITYLNKLGK